MKKPKVYHLSKNDFYDYKIYFFNDFNFKKLKISFFLINTMIRIIFREKFFALALL